MNGKVRLGQLLSQVSLESEKKSNIELEYVFYGRIKNFEQLKQAASREEHEQWDIRVEKESSKRYFGNVRVRCTDGGKYTLCIKALEDGVEAKEETELEANEELFEAIKKIATGGMRKTRYRFPIEGSELTWEVDVFYDTEGNPREWCKIDLEVESQDGELPAYPIDLEDVLDIQPTERSEEQKAFVDKLMNEQFQLKNLFLKE